MTAVSTDTRNSLYVWAVMLALFGLNWVLVRFDLTPSAPAWLHWVLGCVNLLVFGRFLLGLWQRRASNPNNPNNPKDPPG